MICVHIQDILCLVDLTGRGAELEIYLVDGGSNISAPSLTTEPLIKHTYYTNNFVWNSFELATSCSSRGPPSGESYISPLSASILKFSQWGDV